MFIFAGAEAEILAISQVAKFRNLRIFAGTFPACEIFILVHCFLPHCSPFCRLVINIYYYFKCIYIYICI